MCDGDDYHLLEYMHHLLEYLLSISCVIRVYFTVKILKFGQNDNFLILTCFSVTIAMETVE